jgi:hypothetical protein
MRRGGWGGGEGKKRYSGLFCAILYSTVLCRNVPRPDPAITAVNIPGKTNILVRWYGIRCDVFLFPEDEEEGEREREREREREGGREGERVESGEKYGVRRMDLNREELTLSA